MGPAISRFKKIISSLPYLLEYMAFVVKKPPTKKQFLRNLDEKQEDPDFFGDMEALIRNDVDYNQGEAFEWLREEFIGKLK